MAKKKKSTPATPDLNLYLVAFLVVFIVGAVWYVLTTTQANLVAKNQIESQQLQLIELKSRGVNPENISIRKIPVNYSFTSGKLSYEVKNAYLTPDIADFGDQRQSYNIGTENKFLVVEVKGEYALDTGAKEDLMVNKFVIVRQGTKVYQPVSVDNLRVGPLDTLTAFVVFVVPMDTTEFTLVSGPAGRGKVTTLDFTSGTDELMQGVFLLQDGYAPSYPY